MALYVCAVDVSIGLQCSSSILLNFSIWKEAKEEVQWVLLDFLGRFYQYACTSRKSCLAEGVKAMLMPSAYANDGNKKASFMNADTDGINDADDAKEGNSNAKNSSNKPYGWCQYDLSYLLYAFQCYFHEQSLSMELNVVQRNSVIV